MKLAKKMSRKLRFESLETRALLTGTVTATAEGGILTLTGDNAGNAVIMHQVGTSTEGGINVRVAGVATKINNLDTGTTGNAFTFTGITDISVDMSGGNDVLTFSNTTIPGSLTIDMGSGNDVLTMFNIHELGGVIPGTDGLRARAVTALDAFITLGTGNDVAVLTNVTSAGDINLDAGDGRDVVVLTKVVAGTVGSGNTLSVEMGPGNLDVLTVTFSSADFASFTDTDGTAGILVRAHNQFGEQSNSGFRLVV